MKTLLTLLLLLLLQSETIAAPPTEASVENLLELMNAKATLEQSYEQTEKIMRGMAQQAAGPRPLTEKEAKSLDTVVAKTLALMKMEMNWETLKPSFVRLYMNTFNQEELDGLASFYGSTAGQAFIKKMPEIIRGSMEISQAQMKTLMPKLMQIVQESSKQ